MPTHPITITLGPVELSLLAVCLIQHLAMLALMIRILKHSAPPPCPPSN